MSRDVEAMATAIATAGGASPESRIWKRTRKAALAALQKQQVKWVKWVPLQRGTVVPLSEAQIQAQVDPVTNGQTTEEEIAGCQADPRGVVGGDSLKQICTTYKNYNRFNRFNFFSGSALKRVPSYATTKHNRKRHAGRVEILRSVEATVPDVDTRFLPAAVQ